ncbi:MAG TPA: hypothetical protein PLQ35_11180 [bacterium]|nr:hypothetical protein [bacterium]HQL62844.1 hypothetical protein [bacterium]
MVEKITADAFRAGLDRLNAAGTLSTSLRKDLQILQEGLDRVSNWEQAENHFKQVGIGVIEASGPMSKVYRILACLMESLEKHTANPVEGGWSIDSVSLLDVESGCSTYTGRLVVRVKNRNGNTAVLIDGPFVWDCAAHGIPQTEAAQAMGYRCIVKFPEIQVP